MNEVTIKNYHDKPVCCASEADNRLSCFVAILIVFAPVFSNYIFYGPISIGDVFIFSAIIFIFKHFRYYLFNILSIIISIYIIIISYIFLHDYGIDLGFYRLAIYYLLFNVVVSLGNVNYERLISVYIKLALFFSLSIIVQWILYILFNFSIPLQLPIPYYEADTLKVVDGIFRSGGWFKEPSYFAIFITPALFYLLNSRYIYIYCTIACAGIISTSSLAIFVIIVSTFVYYTSAISRLLVTILLLPTFVILIYCGINYFGDFTSVSRIVDIFTYGGTLVERFLPLFDIIRLSTGLMPKGAANQLVIVAGDSGSVWYSSACYILSSLGWFGIVYLLVSFCRLGALAGAIMLALTLTTHFFNSSYSLFMALTFLGVNAEITKYRQQLNAYKV